MLELLGKSYIIDHCYNYLKNDSENTALKVYITDAIKAVVENTGRLTKDGVAMRKRFADIINNVPDGDKNEDSKKRAESIKDRIKSKLAKLGKEDAQNG